MSGEASRHDGPGGAQVTPGAGGQEPIGVIGVGWVGLVTAACFAELGHTVIARDIVAEKIASLSRGESPIHEPGLADLLARNAERLNFTTEMDEVLERARLLLVCVDTPPTYSGDADLSRVRSVVSELSPGTDHALVMKSTVPAGTGLSIKRELDGLAYVSCPEFLKEGSAVEDFMHPDRVVIGADPGDERAAEAVEAIYRPLGGELVRTDVTSAEMIKLASNAFLATKISFINEIANVCEEVGADVSEVARGMGLDERIGASFLRPGIGYGGSCFDGSETLLVRHDGWPRLLTFAELWELVAGDPAVAADVGTQLARPDGPGTQLARPNGPGTQVACPDGPGTQVARPDGPGTQLACPDGLSVWSWVPGEDRPEWMPAGTLTRRDYEGPMVEVESGGGRIRVTADHPFVVGDGVDDEVLTVVLAAELTEADFLPHSIEAPSATMPNFKLGMAISGNLKLGGGLGGTTFREAATIAWSPVSATRGYRARLPVYSIEVPGSQTVVTTGGMVAHNCFPKDVNALKMLAGNSGYHFQLLNAVIEVNELQKRRVVGKLAARLGSLVGRRVALLGLAFKPNTDDMREASSLVLAARLIGEGAEVVAYDPVASEAAAELLEAVELSDSAMEALDGADAAILVTEWPEFAELDWAEAASRMATPLLVDGRNFLDPGTLRAAGFEYEGIGRGGPPVAR
ncbi:MAG: nucleotide sugar dehydrogenase [Solirubrobacterales bacterium]